MVQTPQARLMLELDANDKPIKASTFNWIGKGFDGFLGFGIDKETGECCKDCICDNNCTGTLPPTFYIIYSWEQPCRDLDTQTTFLGNSVGFGCDNIARNMSWVSGDDTGIGGLEVVAINFDIEEANDRDYTISTYAHWHEPAWQDDCSGKFTIYVTAEAKFPDKDNPAFLEKEFNTSTLFRGCSQNFIAKIKFNKDEIKWA